MKCSQWNLKTALLDELIPSTDGIERVDVSDGVLAINYDNGTRREVRWKEE